MDESPSEIHDPASWGGIQTWYPAAASCSASIPLSPSSPRRPRGPSACRRPTRGYDAPIGPTSETFAHPRRRQVLLVLGQQGRPGEVAPGLGGHLAELDVGPVRPDVLVERRVLPAERGDDRPAGHLGADPVPPGRARVLVLMGPQRGGYGARTAQHPTNTGRGSSASSARRMRSEPGVSVAYSPSTAVLPWAISARSRSGSGTRPRAASGCRTPARTGRPPRRCAAGPRGWPAVRLHAGVGVARPVELAGGVHQPLDVDLVAVQQEPQHGVEAPVELGVGGDDHAGPGARGRAHAGTPLPDDVRGEHPRGVVRPRARAPTGRRTPWRLRPRRPAPSRVSRRGRTP